MKSTRTKIVTISTHNIPHVIRTINKMNKGLLKEKKELKKIENKEDEIKEIDIRIDQMKKVLTIINVFVDVY